MPNQITANGIEIDDLNTIISDLETGLKAIYGNDINLASDTPDGQAVNLYAQAAYDLAALLVQVYNSFDPDNAVGRVLDQRVAINGIQRNGGTYTLTNVTIVVDQAVSLPGLDTQPDDPFTVKDAAGNKWFLVAAQNPAVAGSYVYQFRAELPGAVLTTINTITSLVTIILGVASCNNPTTYTSLGINEETDAVLKIRRSKSVALPSQGYLDGLLAALLNVSGVTSALVFENKSGTTDINGVPGHSIWVIVAGTAANADIAEAIYKKRNAGCGMYGATSYTITQVDGTLFQVLWDVASTEDLYIEFDASSLDGVTPPNTAAILAGLVSQDSFAGLCGVGEKININDLATAVQNIDNNTLVTNAGFSKLLIGPYTPTLTPTTKAKQFLVDASKIAITVV